METSRDRLDWQHARRRRGLKETRELGRMRLPNSTASWLAGEAMPDATDFQPAYSVAGLARAWGISPRRVYDLCARAELGHIRIGSTIPFVPKTRQLTRQSIGTPQSPPPITDSSSRGDRFHVVWWQDGKPRSVCNGGDRAQPGGNLAKSVHCRPGHTPGPGYAAAR